MPRGLRPQPAPRRKGDAYVRSLAVVVLVSTVALTLGDYVFKSAVARAIPPAELGAFFGGFYTVLNLLALVAQLVVGGWLFRAIGPHRVLWILPALYHPSQRVVLRALELFALAGRADFLPVAARLMRHADAEVRAAALRAGTRVRPDEALLRTRGSSGVSFRPGPGFPLGALEALGEVPRWYEAVAETPVVTLQGHMGVLVDVFEDNFGIAMDYLAVIAQSTLRILDWVAARGEEEPLLS